MATMQHLAVTRMNNLFISGLVFALMLIIAPPLILALPSTQYSKGFKAGLQDGRIGVYDQKSVCNTKECSTGYHDGFVKICVHSEAGCGGVSVVKNHTNNNIIVHHKHKVHNSDTTTNSTKAVK